MNRVLITVAALLLGIGTAAAGTADDKFDKGHPPGFSEGKKSGWDDAGKDHHPPGWDQGEKEGWSDDDKDRRPPGLAKKDDYKDDYKDRDHKDKY